MKYRNIDRNVRSTVTVAYRHITYIQRKCRVEVTSVGLARARPIMTLSLAWLCGASRRGAWHGAGWFTISEIASRRASTTPIASMDHERQIEIMLVLALYLRQRRRRRCNRSVWVRSIFRRRQQQGEYHQLLQEMRMADPESHFRYLRMSKERFDSLLAMVSHKVVMVLL